MKLQDYCLQLLKGPTLEDKLISSDSLDWTKKSRILDYLDMPKLPARENKIAFTSQQLKFPKAGSLHLQEKRAMALHYFANHELLAIEMMAAALLYFPCDQRTQKSIIKALGEEQKHFRLYKNRMEELGGTFGECPLNDFFWRQIKLVKNIEQYFAVVSLTFEAANLDFCLYYQDLFSKYDDHRSASIMEIVYQDEITHVGMGYKYLKNRSNSQEIYSHWESLLPGAITPARAKGMIFDFKGRVKSGMNEEMVNKIKNYSDNFKITQRKKIK